MYVNETPKKVAIVCDWLTEIGGAEQVILAIHKLYPNAPIYTSQYRPQKAAWFDECDVRTGWLNKTPVKLRRLIPFLRQWYFSHLDLTEYDIVISVTGAEAKAVRFREDAVHISYIHAPTQYYWTLYDQYIKNPGFGFFNPLVRLGLRLFVKPLRKADYRSAQKPTQLVANSSYIREEIKKHYKRDSHVIWPNVDTQTISTTTQNVPWSERSGFIMFGRQVSWKRFDLAIDAAIKTGSKLSIFGDGPEHSNLVKRAKNQKNIHFYPRYNGFEEIAQHVASSSAFLFPSIEPFGIAAVEALAAGTPVIALRAGGAIDIVNHKNGIFFSMQTVESLAAAMLDLPSHTFDPKQIKETAEQFSEAAFRQKMRTCINHTYENRKNLT